MIPLLKYPPEALEQIRQEAALDPLVAFAYEFFTNSDNLIGQIPYDRAMHRIGDVTSVTWYRDHEFQIQMFIMPPHHIVPEHTHPNVDSIELNAGGQVCFSRNGRWADITQDLDGPDQNGLPHRRWAHLRVKPDYPHGGVIGPAGGVFFSIQRWLNGVAPHCVAADYVGVVMDQEHMDAVVAGQPQIKTQLTWRDAATLETTPPPYEYFHDK